MGYSRRLQAALVSRLSVFVTCSESSFKSRCRGDMVTSIEPWCSQPYLVITIYPIHIAFTTYLDPAICYMMIKDAQVDVKTSNRASSPL